MAVEPQMQRQWEVHHSVGHVLANSVHHVRGDIHAAYGDVVAVVDELSVSDLPKLFWLLIAGNKKRLE